MGWQSYAVKRIGLNVFVLLGASIIVFSIIHLVPGDPAKIILGKSRNEAALEALRQQLGLHLPLWKQYLIWLWDFITLDWGESVISGHSVKALVLDRYVRSLELGIAALLITVVIAIPLGTIAAISRPSKTDYLAIFFSQLGVSVPSFWLGIIFILLFAKHLRLVPASGYVPISEDPVANLQHVFLPALSLGIVNAAIITRYVRSEMLEKLGEDYVKTAYAFGHPKWRIIIKYVLKNALIPTITVLGIQFGYLIGGVVVIEQVFSYPGIGLLILNSILTRDYPMAQVSLMILATTFIFVNLIVDLLYSFLNPKIRY